MREKFVFIFKVLAVVASFSPLIALAQANAESTYLDTMNLFSTISAIIFALCHIAGIVFAFMSVVYYRRYRQNPNETPISRVLWVLGLGILIFCLPWAAEQNSIYQEMQAASEQVEGQ
jgi:high-affinity K+ transport system ATPase subunit B